MPQRMEPSSIQKTQNLAPRTEWLAVALSGSLLCIVVWLYPELFLFRKTVVLQAWARGLPYSLHAGAYLGFVVLLPVALLAKSKRRLLGWYLAIVAIATLPASLSPSGSPRLTMAADRQLHRRPALRHLDDLKRCLAGRPGHPVTAR